MVAINQEVGSDDEDDVEEAWRRDSMIMVLRDRKEHESTESWIHLCWPKQFIDVRC